MSYSEQRRAWNQMAHAKEWNANRPPDVLKLTFNSAAGAGVEQGPGEQEVEGERVAT